MGEAKEVIKGIFIRYCIVFTLVVGGNMLVIWMNGTQGAYFSMSDLVTIQIMAALCGLGDLFFIHSSEDTKVRGMIRSVIHYVYINAIVLILTILRTSIPMRNIWIVAISIAVIYWINIVLDFYQSKKDVLKMNDMLQKINKNDE
ncbi:MAG: hypothetical protein Q4G58_06870 [bacterium]|nr:hypothetical protein [bacterium]